MTDNIYAMRNKCPKCGTEIDCEYTDNIKCVCPKHNCKHEFKKSLQGAIGITLRKEAENNWCIIIDKTKEKNIYPSFEDMDKDLDIFRKQQQIIEQGE